MSTAMVVTTAAITTISRRDPCYRCENVSYDVEKTQIPKIRCGKWKSSCGNHVDTLRFNAVVMTMAAMTMVMVTMATMTATTITAMAMTVVMAMASLPFRYDDNDGIVTTMITMMATAVKS